MDKLWQTQRAPVPLDDQALPVEGEPLADTMLLCLLYNVKYKVHNNNTC